jgi:hydrogenase/urease accessory protein HupE
MSGRPRTALRLSAGLAGSFCATGAAWAHGIHGTQIKALSDGGPLTYLASGAIHMLTGYDHLLFLFGVMFFLTSFGEIVTLITAFTIGHSITLIGATLYGVRVDYFLIDAAIAVSVIYKGSTISTASGAISVLPLLIYSRWCSALVSSTGWGSQRDSSNCLCRKRDFWGDLYLSTWVWNWGRSLHSL